MPVVFGVDLNIKRHKNWWRYDEGVDEAQNNNYEKKRQSVEQLICVHSKWTFFMFTMINWTVDECNWVIKNKWEYLLFADFCWLNLKRQLAIMCHALIDFKLNFNFSPTRILLPRASLGIETLNLRWFWGEIERLFNVNFQHKNWALALQSWQQLNSQVFPFSSSIKFNNIKFEGARERK